MTELSRGGSYAFRAGLAIALFVGFYALAFGALAGVLYLVYLTVFVLHRVYIKLVIGAAVFAFAILRATLFVPRPKFEPPGPEITAADEPRLFALIQDICEKMHTHMPAHVYLIADVNAFVSEVGGFMGFGTRRIMGIGVGLLEVDDTSELRATIAHEFGHYVGGDTRLGGFVYRTRAAIGRVLESLGESVLCKPFEWYGHLFMRITQAISRSQELAADRQSVALAGRDAHIASLRDESRAAVLFNHFLQAELSPLIQADHRPDNLYEGFRAFWQVQAERGTLEVVDKSLHESTTSPWDTHPALPDRIAFAERLPDPGTFRDTTPARKLLIDPAATERRMTDHMIASLGTARRLQTVGWQEISAKVYAPKLTADAAVVARQVAQTFGGEATARAALETLLAKLESTDAEGVATFLEPRVAEVPHDERPFVSEQLVASKLGILFGQALVDRGAEWCSDVGHPHRVKSDGQAFSPFELAARAIGNRDQRVVLRAHLA